eukprot:2904002-Rhodomonas_salina.1
MAYLSAYASALYGLPVSGTRTALLGGVFTLEHSNRRIDAFQLCCCNDDDDDDDDDDEAHSSCAMVESFLPEEGVDSGAHAWLLS